MKRFRLVFEALRDVKKLAKSKTLSEDEKKAAIQSIKAFREAITYPLLKLTMQPKAHFLISHMPEQIEKYASMNFFSEQSIESMHASINKDMFNVTSFNDFDKLLNFMIWHNQRVGFNDNIIRK
uniref:Uncharacterized protein n=1 Tax=Rhabditophanes sp. KR3021 TaxID=114890 RepID=A0AC35UCH9_9BILA